MVITDVNQVVYQGDGATTAFPFTFRIIEATDVKMLLIDADGTETDITSDYFVDTVNSTVHYPGYAPGSEPAEADQPAPVQTGQKLMIYRKLPITQEKDLGDKWPFYVIELGLDKLTMILQDIWDWCGRCLQVSRGQAADAGDDFDPTIPLEAGKVVIGNDAGTGFSSAKALLYKNDGWDAEGQSISNVATPGNVKDATTKEYVDNLIDKLSVEADRYIVFNTVAAMKAADLPAGYNTRTLGYHDINDGGAGIYSIRGKVAGETEDGGSVIFLANGNVAGLITDGTVNVKQFGVYGDGVADDTIAFQKSIDYAKTENLAVYIDGSVYITDTIIVPARSRIFGRTSMYTNGSYIIVDPSCSLALDMSNGQVNISDITIMAKDSIYAPNTDGVYLLGDSYNADSTFKNVTFAYMRKGAIVSGRNVVFFNCGFSHCQYGVYYDFDETINQIRGLRVDGCSFHGIGEEADLNWFENSYSIYFASAKWSQLSILNCTHNQGGCFLYGYGGDFQIENNFIESFKVTPIQLGVDLTETTNPTQNGTVLLQGNIIRGKNGSVTTEVAVPFPDHAIEVKYLNRVVINNNAFSKFAKEAIKISNAVAFIRNNTVQAVGWGGTEFVFLNLNQANVIVTDNQNAGGGTISIAKATNCTIYANSNYAMLLDSNHFTNLTISNSVLVVGAIKGQTPVTFELPMDFEARGIIEGHYVFFHCVRDGLYISSSLYRVSNTSTYELFWTLNTDNVFVPRVIKNDNGTITSGAWTLNVTVMNF